MAVFGLVLGLLSLLAALLGLAPGFQGTKYGKLSVDLAKESLELDSWQAKVTFRTWCQDERVFEAFFLDFFFHDSMIADYILTLGCWKTAYA